MGARVDYDSSEIWFMWKEYDSSRPGLTVLAITGHL